MIEDIKEKVTGLWNNLNKNMKIFICAAAVILVIALIQGVA
tara:strand:+ start:368 stop:490 length:123 start_codon:yes stop_codon:yes gene_type:complete